MRRQVSVMDGEERRKYGTISRYGTVSCNEVLDNWSNGHCNDGSTGNHLGLTARKNGDLVLIHSTQHENPKGGFSDWAEDISVLDALYEVMTRNHSELLLQRRFWKLRNRLEEIVDAAVSDGELKNGFVNDRVSVWQSVYTGIEGRYE